MGCFRGLPGDRKHAAMLARWGRGEPELVASILRLNRALVGAAARGDLPAVVGLVATTRPGDLVRRLVVAAFVAACKYRHPLVVAFMLQEGVTPSMAGEQHAVFEAIGDGTATPVVAAPAGEPGAAGGSAPAAGAASGSEDAPAASAAGAAGHTAPGDDMAAMEAAAAAAVVAIGGESWPGRLSAVLRLLAAAGFDVASGRKPGWDTPLHAAVRAGEAGAVSLLLQTPGVDPSAVDGADETPLGAARASGHAAIEAALVRAGGTIGWRSAGPAGDDAWATWAAGRATSSAAAATGAPLARSVRSGGASCGVGGFRPPTAEEFESLPQMQDDDEDRVAAGHGGASDTVPGPSTAATLVDCAVSTVPRGEADGVPAAARPPPRREADSVPAAARPPPRREADGGLTLAAVG